MDARFNNYMEGQLRGNLSDIEMPDSYYAKAETAYAALTKYLTRRDSEIRQYDPEISLQGSIKTGTAIKPITDDGSYDVDIVCNLLHLTKSDITQKQFKSLVGIEVRGYASKHNMEHEPRDGKRCWTLEYADEANFHMDVLPTIDNTEWHRRAMKFKGLEFKPEAKFLAHTDKRRDDYEQITQDWLTTNPSGYADWFLDAAMFNEYRTRTAEKRAYASVEEMKVYEVKAPLQQYVQILKRHRDIWFSERPNHSAPRSIVITTLAGKAYEGIATHAGWFEDMSQVLLTMTSFIQKDNEGYRLCNPANELENFLEEWSDEDASFFDEWIKAAISDLLSPGCELRNDFPKDVRTQMRRSLGLPTNSGLVTRTASELLRKISSLSHHKTLSLPIVDIVPVSIRAEKCWGGGIFRQFQSGDPLPKEAELKFYAVADDLKHYEVKWQITNDGAEATKAKCLRGGFYQGKIVNGRRFRGEETSYLGKHYVECYLIKDGVCYGQSEPFIVNITNTKESYARQ